VLAALVIGPHLSECALRGRWLLRLMHVNHPFCSHYIRHT
jgi:hypothetical protein